MSSNDPDTGRGHAIADSETLPLPALVARGAVGGILMGLANLVPGISGGTMLLAAGVYPTFIAAIAAVTTLRFSTRSFVALAAIGGSAVLAILLLAGTMRDLVVEQRWAMYSIFIGLTLGGVPLVWRMARPVTPAVWIAAAAGFAVMALMAFGGSVASSGTASAPILLLSGLAGASAMILPGVSGGYLLLLLGQYEPILGAIDMLKTGLLGTDGSGFDMAIVLESMRVVVPVGIGVVIGVVAVSNLLKWLLERYEKATLGVLLGLLVGAVVGLYPFQAPLRPAEGHVHRGIVLNATEVAALEQEYWPLERFTPTGAQIAGAVGLLLAGFVGTMLIDRIGRTKATRPRSVGVALLVMFALSACSRESAVPETSTPATAPDAQNAGIVDAAEDIIAFLRGELPFDSITTADTVTIRLAPEGGGDSTRVSREMLRERASWSVRTGSGSDYPFAPPATLTTLTTREGRHFNCQEYELSSRAPDLAAFPHVGTRLAPPDADSCLQTWNVTFVFDPQAAHPTLVAAVYDQWEW